MPWVRTVTAEEATGPLAAFFERVNITSGRMFTPFEVLTANGPVLTALAELCERARFGPSELTRLQREVIATYVSALNRCTF